MRTRLQTLFMASWMAFAAMLSACGTSPNDGPGQTAALPQGAELPLPSVHLLYSAQHGLELHGTVPDEHEHHALVQQAHALYGAHRVSDHLRAGAVANPNWLNAAYLPDLRGLSDASVRLADARLEVEGQAPSEALRQALQQALADIGRHGLQVRSRLSLTAG